MDSIDRPGPARRKWYDLFSRGARDWLRHNEKVRDAVRDNLPEIIAGADVLNERRPHGARSGAHARALSLPTARARRMPKARARAAPSPATCSQSRPRGQGREGARAGSDEGDVQFVLELKVDDIVDWLWEEMQAAESQGTQSGRCGRRRTACAKAGTSAARARGSIAAARSRRRSSAARSSRTPRRPSPTTICASASSRGASSPATHAVVFFALDVSGSMSRPGAQAREDASSSGSCRACAAQYAQLETVFVAHTDGSVGVQRDRVLPGERHRRHGRVDRPEQGARDHRRALQPGPQQRLSLLRVRRRELRPAIREAGACRTEGGRGGGVLHRLRRGVVGAGPAARHRDRPAAIAELDASELAAGSYALTDYDDIWNAVRQFFAGERKTIESHVDERRLAVLRAPHRRARRALGPQLPPGRFRGRFRTAS